MAIRGVVLKYGVRSLIFIRRYDDTNFPCDFLDIFYKLVYRAH